MERLRFIMELVDKVTGPSRRIVQSLNRVRHGFQRISGEMGTLGSLTHMLYAQRLARLHQGLKAVSDSSIVRGLSSIADKLWMISKRGAMALGAISTLAAGKLVIGVGKMAAHFETTMLALKSVTGSTAQANKEFRETRRLAKDLGLDLVATQKEYTKLRAMGFSQKRATDFLKLGADLKAAGLADEEGYKRFLRAATQVMGKGRLQAEELNQQFSEANVPVNMVLAEIRDRLGLKDTAAAAAAISNSQVNADLGLDAIQAAIMKMKNITTPGEIARQGANQVRGLWERVTQIPTNFFARMMEDGGVGVEHLKDAMRDLVDLFDRIDTSQAREFVATFFESLRNAVPKLEDFLTGFGQGFRQVMADLRAGMGGELDFVRIGEMTAKALGVMVRGFQLVGRALEFLQTPAGEFVAWTVLAGGGMGKLLGWATALTGGVRELWTLLGKAPFFSDKVVGAFALISDRAKALLVIMARFAALPVAIASGVVAAKKGLESLLNSAGARGEEGGWLRKFSWLWNQDQFEEVFGKSGVSKASPVSDARNAKPSEAAKLAMGGGKRPVEYRPEYNIYGHEGVTADELMKAAERQNRRDMDMLDLQGVMA